jgi:hypothetical protein
LPQIKNQNKSQNQLKNWGRNNKKNFSLVVLMKGKNYLNMILLNSKIKEFLSKKYTINIKPNIILKLSDLLRIIVKFTKERINRK